jgi:hypothetical protein
LPAPTRGSVFFGYHHTRLDADIAGVRCIGLNKVAMPGNLVDETIYVLHAFQKKLRRQLRPTSTSRHPCGPQWPAARC